MYMKQLLLILSLNAISLVGASEQYPFIKRYLPEDSLVRQQCEGSPNFVQNKEIGQACELLNRIYLLFKNKISDDIPPAAKKFISPDEFLMIRRDHLRRLLNYKDVEAKLDQGMAFILRPLQLSPADIITQQCIYKDSLFVAIKDE
jgi:hypothetical protein